MKEEYPGTKKYIKDRHEEECSKENISVDKVIFLFTYHEAENYLAQKKNFFIL